MSHQINIPRVITILNGPNLNMLGQREPEIYGSNTLDNIHSECENYILANFPLDKKKGDNDGFSLPYSVQYDTKLNWKQSNHEGELVEHIQKIAEEEHIFTKELKKEIEDSVLEKNSISGSWGSRDTIVRNNWEDSKQKHHLGLIINAAAYTHTSIAIHDALKLLSIPIIEVHLSNPKEREEFRHHSYITPIADKVISGKGTQGYIEALKHLKEKINNENKVNNTNN